jgi:hypothetical protein
MMENVVIYTAILWCTRLEALKAVTAKITGLWNVRPISTVTGIILMEDYDALIFR